MRAFVFILVSSLFIVVLARIAVPTPPLNKDIICPDAVSVCPGNTTCCISTDGDYSCCPIQDGVCCADHLHCCPEHYKCDLKIFKCDHVLFPMPLMRMQPRLNKN